MPPSDSDEQKLLQEKDNADAILAIQEAFSCDERTARKLWARFISNTAEKLKKLIVDK